VASRLMKEPQQLHQELADEYEHLRQQYAQEQEQLLSLDEARKNKLKLF
jgi:5-methyltetrahydrofolate--homocysteine methyltransferase